MNSLADQHQREQHNTQFFDRWADKYDEFRITSWFQYTQKLTLGQFDWRQDAKLLDVGCGTGHAVLTAASALPDGKACGIDISSVMLEQAKQKIPAQKEDRIEFKLSGAENIPYDDDHFDFVMCSNSFHHYDDPSRALTEMRRVLKLGGTLVIFENATDLSLYTWAWDKFLRLFEKGHVKYYTSAELGQMIKDGGFDSVELRVLKNERLKHGKLFASIQIWAATAPSAS